MIACALRPLGVRFAQPLPAGVHDFGVEVWSQPDAFVPYDPAGPDDLAAFGRTQAEVLAADDTIEAGSRLITTANPGTPDGLPTFTQPLIGGGSTVWVARMPTRRAGSRSTTTSVRPPPSAISRPGCSR